MSSSACGSAAWRRLARASKASEVLSLVGLEDRADRYPRQLSGGEQQRVALARALALEPRMLLLDEPLSALDAKVRVQLRQEIRAIKSRLGITTIYVTHDQEEAFSISDRVVIMSAGRIQQAGRPAEIYRRPQNLFVAEFVGTVNRLEGTVADAGTVAMGRSGTKVSVPPHDWPAGEVAIETDLGLLLADIPSEQALGLPLDASLTLQIEKSGVRLMSRDGTSQ